MAKKLTQYEINCVLRQLEMLIIKPITEENQKIIDQSADDMGFVKDIADLKTMLQTKRELHDLIDQWDNKIELILEKYNANNYYARNNPIEFMERKHLEVKISTCKLNPIPTLQELQDLIILNSNLNLLEIIDLITAKFKP